MKAQYRCRNEKRRHDVTNTKGSDGKPILNGIDYLEVEPGQTELKIYLLKDLPQNSEDDKRHPKKSLSKENVSIEGGIRIKGISVVDLNPSKTENNALIVTVCKPGDFSTYTLRLIDNNNPSRPLNGFDPRLSEVQFSFKAECRSDFDCLKKTICMQEKLPEPKIDYLAKDYASFRQLMLDRLSVIAPDLKERNPADAMIALVEALSYLGDHLSYYQDAVATEAYLGTAQRRVSVRRHARLLDYFMHDGCNARTWVILELEKDPSAGSNAEEKKVYLPAGTMLLSSTSAAHGQLPADLMPYALKEGAQVFETMHDIMLYSENQKMDFYFWSDEQCCLPKGATRATLDGHYPNLNAGDVLIFEENFSPTSGRKEDADPSHRWAVRLTNVKAIDAGNKPDEESKPLVDPLNGNLITEIEWDPGDALPFPLCLTATDAEHGRESIKVSTALGNVVLADHGRTMPKEDLDAVPSQGSYRPVLKYGPITQQGYVLESKQQNARWVFFDEGRSASSVFSWDLRNIKPAIKLLQTGNENRPWQPKRDLLESGRFSRDFVFELNNDGLAYLRFGDGTMGEQPEARSEFSATYRVGNGKVGNVGRDTITNIITDVPGIKSVRNPMPAQGGEDPEIIEQVRLYAPQAFRRQERAVTEEDYANVAERHPDVQKAVATIRWTGSWYTVFVAIDRTGGLPVDAEFKQDMCNYLDLYRMMGHDLEIGGPIYVPLDIAVDICVKAGYFRSNVLEALLVTFSNYDLPQGGKGFFHPDNFTFGQPIFLSRIYKTAMDVPGVASVKMKKFQRWGRAPNQEIANRVLTVGRLEIVRLDNDRNFPENGKIDFNMGGGI